MRSLFFQRLPKTQVDRWDPPTDGQKFFSLSKTPRDPVGIRFFINELETTEVEGAFWYDANLNRVQSLLPYRITTTDQVRIEYPV